MVSRQLKNLIGRLTSIENMIVHVGRSLLNGKIAGFLAAGNDSGSIMAIAYLMVTFNSMGVHIPPWALVYPHNKTDILNNREAILSAYNVGYNVVKAARLVSTLIRWYKVDANIDKMVNEIRKVCEKRGRLSPAQGHHLESLHTKIFIHMHKNFL